MKIIVIDYIYEVDYDVTADFSKEPMTESQEEPDIFMGRNKPSSVFCFALFCFSENEADSPLAVTITLLTPTFYRDSEPLNKPAMLCLVTQSCPTLCNPMDCSLSYL